MKRIEVYKKRKHGGKKGGLWWKILTPVVACAMFFFICLIAGAFDQAVQITVEAADIEILQGEELPEFLYIYAREVEHEESNLEYLEKRLASKKEFNLNIFLACILSPLD